MSLDFISNFKLIHKFQKNSGGGNSQNSPLHCNITTPQNMHKDKQCVWMDLDPHAVPDSNSDADEAQGNAGSGFQCPSLPVPS